MSAIRDPRRKILSPARLKRALSSKKQSRVVFTNGCFDLLHRGHVEYLAQARQLGSCLIVALNSDASVKRLKGPERPLNPLSDRLRVMAALECVDFVTWFGTSTPLQLIRSLRPQILVKGGDWDLLKIVGASDVLSWGGQVKALPYLKGRSTTRLVSKARSTKRPVKKSD